MIPIKLQKIVEQTYKIFENYRIKGSLGVCKVCCVTDEQEKLLISTPLRKLSLELLTVYNDSAKTEFQNAEELKYFLPRMLELVAQLQFPSHSCEICLQRIGMVRKEEWKKEELELIQTFAEDFFEYCLSITYLSRNSESIDSILIMFDKAKIDIQHLLAIWLKQNNYESSLWYSDIILNGIKEKAGKKSLINGFADKLCSEIVVNFLFDDKVRKHFATKIEAIIMNNETKDNNELEVLNYAYELLK